MFLQRPTHAYIIELGNYNSSEMIKFVTFMSVTHLKSKTNCAASQEKNSGNGTWT